MKKIKCFTVGELIDFLLEKNFNKEDKVIVETLHTEKDVKDVGIATINGRETKLLISIR